MLSSEQALIVMLILGVLALVLMFLGWRRRTQRDAALVAPTRNNVAEEILYQASGLYVATTAHQEPLNRLAIQGLAYRSKATFVVTAEGLYLDGPSTEIVFLPKKQITEVTRATFTIDRVVETGGLIVVSWCVAQDRLADTFLRLQQEESQMFMDALTEVRAKTVAEEQSQ